MKKLFGIFFIILASIFLVSCKNDDHQVEIEITELVVEVKTMSFVMTVEDLENEITGNISIRLTAVASNTEISTRTTNKDALIEGKQTLDYINLTPSTEYRISISAVIGQKSVSFEPETFTTKAEDSVITTVEEFLNISSNRTGNYELANDLDFTGVEFTSLFLQQSNGFAGTFDGKGFELQNITFKSMDSYTGIFGNVSSGKILNVTLNNVTIGTEETPLTINKTTRVGLVAGYLGTNASEVKNVSVINSRIHVTSSSTISLYVGGLVGENALGTIEDITLDQVEVNVKSTSTGNVKVGGVVGFMSDNSSFSAPKLMNVVSNANVGFTLANTRIIDKSLSFIVGGVVGDNNAQQVNVSVQNILNSGNIALDLDFGTQSGTTDRSYTVNVGGIMGRSYSNMQSAIFAGSISLDHVANEFESSISKTFNVGGLVGSYIIGNPQRITNQLLRLGDSNQISISYTGEVNLRISHTIANQDSTSSITTHHYGELITLVNAESASDLDPSNRLMTLDDYFTSEWLEEAYQDFIE
ncbi:MAG: hypothetical protein RBT45_03370 [Acholeplasmataceae bacterium]|jgi:hypothetical protein|nr:hypothetical protein [Acholeplasmataceae bacterium]